MKMLEIKNLSILTPHPLITNLNLSIEENSIFVLFGKSGSGKTQIAKAIMKISKLECIGQIYVDNKREYELGKDVAIIFQNFDLCLNPVLKIKEQIIESMIYHKICNKKEALKRAKELVYKLNLDEDVLEKYPFELSGGQKQRVVIAIAIALDAKVLICDEISTGLDPINEYEILTLLKSLNKTILLITHNLEIVKNFATHLAILENKKIVESGKIEEILKNPKSEYLKEILRLSGELYD